MCVSYGISLCLCEIRIYLFGLFTFAKLPDNSIRSKNLWKINGIGFMMRYINIKHPILNIEYYDIWFYSHSPSPFFWALYIIRSVLEKGSPGRGQLVHPFPSSNVASFSLTHEPWSWAAKKSRPFTLTSPFFSSLTLCLFLELRFTITCRY